jgi:hypothetical protein
MLLFFRKTIIIYLYQVGRKAVEPYGLSFRLCGIVVAMVYRDAENTDLLIPMLSIV